jgi:hypothetical protein
MEWDYRGGEKRKVSYDPFCSTFHPYAPRDLAFWKRCCFWKAFSVCSAIVDDVGMEQEVGVV